MFYMATCYAVRDSETKERLSYRYYSMLDLWDSIGSLARYEHTGRTVEVYRSKMSRPIACKPRRGKA